MSQGPHGIVSPSGFDPLGLLPPSDRYSFPGSTMPLISAHLTGCFLSLLSWILLHLKIWRVVLGPVIYLYSLPWWPHFTLWLYYCLTYLDIMLHFPMMSSSNKSPDFRVRDILNILHSSWHTWSSHAAHAYQPVYPPVNVVIYLSHTLFPTTHSTVSFTTTHIIKVYHWFLVCSSCTRIQPIKIPVCFSFQGTSLHPVTSFSSSILIAYPSPHLSGTTFIAPLTPLISHTINSPKSSQKEFLNKNQIISLCLKPINIYSCPCRKSQCGYDDPVWIGSPWLSSPIALTMTLTSTNFYFSQNVILIIQESSQFK